MTRQQSSSQRDEIASASAQIKKGEKNTKAENIIPVCKGSTRVSKDDWMEWLRR